ncbi:MAG: TRAM domain-containing protein, partial [Thermococcus sp.]
MLLHRLTLQTAYNINRAYVGRTVEVLVHGPGKKGGVEGRTFNYKEVILDSGSAGEVTEVKVTWAGSTYLRGVPVED